MATAYEGTHCERALFLWGGELEEKLTAPTVVKGENAETKGLEATKGRKKANDMIREAGTLNKPPGGPNLHVEIPYGDRPERGKRRYMGETHSNDTVSTENLLPSNAP